MKKYAVIVSAILAVMLISCATTSKESPDQRAIAAGVKAWNDREPEAAAPYWNEIKDEKVKKQYENHIASYKAGAEALESTDSTKNEAKLLAACNTAIAKFSSLDPALKVPSEVAEKGASLSAGRIDGLVAAGKTTQAKKLYESAVKLYGNTDELTFANKETDVVSSLLAKKA